MLQSKEAEAMSLKKHSHRLKRGFQRCIFETDSKLLVNACKGEHGKSFFHTTIKDYINFFNTLIRCKSNL